MKIRWMVLAVVLGAAVGFQAAVDVERHALAGISHKRQLTTCG